jgi:hypothetical protein
MKQPDWIACGLRRMATLFELMTLSSDAKRNTPRADLVSARLIKTLGVLPCQAIRIFLTRKETKLPS